MGFPIPAVWYLDIESGHGIYYKCLNKKNNHIMMEPGFILTWQSLLPGTNQLKVDQQTVAVLWSLSNNFNLGGIKSRLPSWNYSDSSGRKDLMWCRVGWITTITTMTDTNKQANIRYKVQQMTVDYSYQSCYMHRGHIKLINSWNHMDGYSALWLLMPSCWSTRPPVPKVLNEYSLYWTSFIQKYYILMTSIMKNFLLEDNGLVFQGLTKDACG